MTGPPRSTRGSPQHSWDYHRELAVVIASGCKLARPLEALGISLWRLDFRTTPLARILMLQGSARGSRLGYNRGLDALRCAAWETQQGPVEKVWNLPPEVFGESTSTPHGCLGNFSKDF